MAKQFNSYFQPVTNRVWLFLDEYNSTFQDDMNRSNSWFIDETEQPQLNLPCCEIEHSGIAYYTVRFFRANDEFEVGKRDYFGIDAAIHACKLWLRIQDCTE